MQWESIGFKDDPFNTDPITEHSLALYSGNKKKIASCQFALKSKDVLMVVEGARGVGTTSFANYLRFSAKHLKDYFTPTNEIGVQPNWNVETLLAAIISNLVMELELYHHKSVHKNPKFIDAKALVSRISETYRSFGASLFGFGGNYGQSSGPVSQPVIIPSPMLAHHLKALVALVKKIGYRHGILIQLNNLDVGEVQNEVHLKSLLNIMRDFFQLSSMSWLLVGDVGIRRFIAQNVDRLDDIINHEVEITPLSEKEYLELMNKRVEQFRISKAVSLPIETDVLIYLYQLTNGRLRYIFGLLTRLFNTLHVGTLTDRITLGIAKPVIVRHAKDRINQYSLTPTEAIVLKQVVAHEVIAVNELSKILDKKSNQISAVLAKLLEYRLVGFNRESRSHLYYPSIDATIAYSPE